MRFPVKSRRLPARVRRAILKELQRAPLLCPECPAESRLVAHVARRVGKKVRR